MTVRELYAEGKRRLAAAGKPAFDAACLLEQLLHLQPGQLPLRWDKEAAEADAAVFRAQLARRAAGEPLQYLLGVWEFYGLSFAVGAGVLVPRQETELLAEAGIAHLRARGETGRLLELCAGSGCVSIAVAKHTGCGGVCLELSDAALPFLRRNIAAHALQTRLRVVQGDMLAGPAGADISGAFDALLCNPPYIPTEELPGLQAEVRREPRMALDGGADGLRFYRALPLWLPLLRAGGLLACEVGQGEADAVASLLRAAGLARVAVRADYAGIGRVVSGLQIQN